MNRLQTFFQNRKTNKAVRKILRDARDLLSEHGWTTGHPRNSHGAYCALGAIYEAGGVFETFDPIKHPEVEAAIRKLAEVVPEQPGYEGLRSRPAERVWRFNDNVAFSSAEVRAAMKKASR